MITAKQIADWAATADAQRELPRLIRRLAHSTASLTHIVMPAGDSVSKPGWDGELFSDHGNAWVPQGYSCWEVSCRQDILAKANEDYRKRTDGTLEELRLSRAYVAVTARQWPGKGKWAAARQAEGSWQQVRAYDADDLENWLEQSPGVAVAFAEELGLSGPGVTSPGAYFKTWSTQCAPAILASAILAGRDRQRDTIIKRCTEALSKASATPLPIQADSVEEAVAFVAAALAGDETLASKAVIVTDAAGWQFVIKNQEISIAIAARPEIADALPARDGLVIIVPYAAGDMKRQFQGMAGRLDDPEVALDRADHPEFEQALQDIGVDKNDSRRMSVLCGRSWSIIRRLRARNPAIRNPAWLRHPAAPALATLCLVGSWSTSRPADLEAVARIAGRDYANLERDLAALAGLDDPPVLHIGHVWKAKAPLELLTLFADRINDAEIERFFDEARAILSAPDPELELEKDKRYAAAIYGKTRDISALLMDAVCDTLIKLAVRALDIPALASRQIDRRVDHFVHDLLHSADETRWLSLASQLPALAEASPSAFLDAVEDSHKRSDAPVKRLLSETDSAGFLGGRCWHHGLLWALEILAWAPQRLTRVALILARLSEVPIAGNWGNSPANTLVDLFRSWFPQTAATIEQRIAVLDILIQREPVAASKLLNALTNIGHDFASPTARPKWRDDDAGAGYGAAGIERHQMLVAAADRQLALASKSADEIAALIGKYESFDDGRRQQVIALAKNAMSFADSEKEIVRSALRRKINWHRNYNDDADSDNFIAPLELLYDQLKPDDLIIRHAWLFKDGWVDLPRNEGGENFEKRQELIKQARTEALSDIYVSLGWSGLVGLGESTSGGWWIGIHAFDIGISEAEATDWICQQSGTLDRGHHLTNIAAGILNAGIRRAGYDFVGQLLNAADTFGHSLEWKVKLLTFAPEEQATWNLVAGLGAEASAAYWQTCVGNVWLHDQPVEMQFALERLLEAERPVTALRACHIKFDGIDPEIIMKILEGIIAGQEADALPQQSYYFEYAIDFLEKSRNIDRLRLARMEFALIKALRFGGEDHAVSLYAILMSQPEVFVELLCLLYKPKNGEPREASEGGKLAAESAWAVLHACKRQPGSDEDGNFTEESVRAFVAKARELAKEQDRLEGCDHQLGEIMARGNPDADGVFPSKPIRDVIEQISSTDMLGGFRTGCFNKRGVYSRGMLDGGEQERDLASEYRKNAKTLEITHPMVASVLYDLAKSYDRHGLMEDLDAKLRREGR